MSDNVPQNKLEIKYSGLAVECGTLEVLLSFLISSPVMIMPLERLLAVNQRTIKQWAVHVTTRPISSGPVYYCTFAAAEVTQLGPSSVLTFPAHVALREDVAIQQGACLQDELLHCVFELLRKSERVGRVRTQVRYRLPNEWVWSVRSQHESIQFRENHWMVTQ